MEEHVIDAGIFTKDGLLTTFILVIIAALMPHSDGQISCQTPQYITINEKGILNCSVSKSVYAFYWYYENIPQSIVTVLEDQQAGPRSNELHIVRNGSLIFNNVSLSDEGRYKIDVILLAGGDVSTSVDVVVVVPSQQTSPEIDGCETTPCYLCSEESLALKCSMTGKPQITLKWFLDLEEVTSTEKSFLPETYTSSASIVVNISTGYGKRLTCMPIGFAVPVDTVNTSILLLGPTDPFSVTLVTYSFPNCTSEVCLVQNAEPRFSLSRQIVCQPFAVVPMSRYPRSLILTSIQEDGGKFLRDSVYYRQYKAPNTNIVSFIEECKDRSNCEFTLTEPKVNLTCTVHNTIPKADIEWILHDKNVYISRLEAFGSCDLDDCSTSVGIEITLCPSRALLECRVAGPWSSRYHSSNITVSTTAPSSTIATTRTTPGTTSTVYYGTTISAITVFASDIKAECPSFPVVLAIVLALIAVVELLLIVVLLLHFSSNSRWHTMMSQFRTITQHKTDKDEKREQDISL